MIPDFCAPEGFTCSIGSGCIACIDELTELKGAMEDEALPIITLCPNKVIAIAKGGVTASQLPSCWRARTGWRGPSRQRRAQG